MNDKDNYEFLHLLVNETFAKNDQEVINEFPINFDEKRKCFVFNYNKLTLEIPMNWNSFSKLESETLGHFVINQDNMLEFLNVFNSYFQTHATSLTVKKIDGSIRLCINQDQIQNAA